MTSANPLFVPSTLQYEAPHFDTIRTEHYAPAFDRGMEEQLAEIAAIKASSADPTFENTVAALETSGRLLKRAQNIFLNLCAACTTPSMQELQGIYAARFAQHSDRIVLDSELYARIHAVYTNREASGLKGEDRRLVEYYEEHFVMAGAAASAEAKEEVKTINERLATLNTEFGRKLLEARKHGAAIFHDAAQLRGLSDAELRAAKEEAASLGHKDGSYALSLLNTTQQPLFPSLDDRETRRALYESSISRATKGGANDTRAIVEEIVRLRLRKAKLLGKKNFAEWKLQDQMADVEPAEKLLDDVLAAAVAKAKEEAVDIEALMKSKGCEGPMQPWDWGYYAEQVRKEKYNLDEAEVKPYFELHATLEKGVFFAAEKLYGLTFKKRTDLPVYDPDVVTYEVFDADGASLALYYLDFYTRDNKNGGAWMTNFVDQSTLLGVRPVIANVFNYPKPADGKPVLLSFWNVKTMFHEFGHTLHGLFSSLKYASLGGIGHVPRDFVEFPSQINEKWALYPTVLTNYARHVDTGAVIPEDLVARISKASSFNEGFSVLEVAATAKIDMSWHTITDEKDFQPCSAFDAHIASTCTIPLVPPRYLSSYCLHIFGGGYAAGYYAYLWSEMLDHDAYEWFTAHGGLTRENGKHFRECVLSVGNSVDLNEAYVKLTGRQPDIKAFLRARSLIA